MPSRKSPIAVTLRETRGEGRAALVGLGAAAGGSLLLGWFPQLEVGVFARSAAWLAGLLTGAPGVRVAEGWMLAGNDLPVVVTAACSATGYFVMLVALVAWQFARQGKSVTVAVVAGFGTAFLLAILVNALRIVTVAQAHRWVIPWLPESYGSFLHMLAGIAVFLPSLIAINLLLEYHGRPRAAARF